MWLQSRGLDKSWLSSSNPSASQQLQHSSPQSSRRLHKTLGRYVNWLRPGIGLRCLSVSILGRWISHRRRICRQRPTNRPLHHVRLHLHTLFNHILRRKCSERFSNIIIRYRARSVLKLLRALIHKEFAILWRMQRTDGTKFFVRLKFYAFRVFRTKKRGTNATKFTRLAAAIVAVMPRTMPFAFEKKMLQFIFKSSISINRTTFGSTQYVCFLRYWMFSSL